MKLYYKELGYLVRYLSLKIDNDEKLNNSESVLYKASKRKLREIERKYYLEKKNLIKEMEPHLKNIDL